MILILTATLPNAILLPAGLAAALVMGVSVPMKISHRDYRAKGQKANEGRLAVHGVR